MLLIASLLMTCFVGSVVPLVNTEIVVLGIMAAAPRHLALPLLFATTVAHMAGKVVVYQLATGLLRLPARDALPARPVLARFEKVFARHAERANRSSVTRTALFTSAATGLPPFYAATIASGTLRIPLREFVFIGTAARLLRFGAIVAFAHWMF